MGRLIVYCDLCGERILEEDFEKGRAHQEAGHNYCAKCRPSTPRSTPATAPRRATALKTPAVAPRHATSSHAASSHAAPSRSTKTPIIAMGVVGAVVVTALILLVVSGRSGSGSGPGGSPHNVSTTGATADPLAEQHKAVEEVKRYASVSPDDHRGIMNRCKLALEKVTDKELALQLQDILALAEGRLREVEAAGSVDGLLAKAQAIRQKDADFVQKVEVRSAYEEARRVGAGRQRLVDRIATAAADYEKALAEAAEKAWKMTLDAAQECETKGDLKEALARLDRFPAQFREGGWARKLDEQKREYEQKIAQTQQQTPKRGLWEDYLRGTKLITEGNYAEGGPILRDVIARCGDQQQALKEITQDQLNTIARNGQYNVACYYARELKDIAAAVRFLEFAIRSGFLDFDHIDKDQDFDSIRDDKRFEEVVNRYRRMIGIEGPPLTEEQAKGLKLAAGQGGIAIQRIVSGSVAEKGGVKPGDVLIEFDKKALPLQNTLEKLREFIKGTKDNVDVPVVVVRDQQKVALKVKWPGK